MVYLTNKYPDSVAVKASQKMLSSAGVECVKYETETEDIVLSFKNN